MNIVVAHTQGGEITGSIDENVRHAVTKLSHIHLVATDRAKQFLVKMGENDRSIYLTGCPAIDLLKDIEKASLINLFTFHDVFCPKYEGTLFRKFLAFPT